MPTYTQDGKRASRIIWEASQEFRINPQVLIVKLQKEAGLITHRSPEAWRFRTAMGYGCPDSGPNFTANCNDNYFGFTNQTRWAARMMRAILNQSPTWWVPFRLGWNDVRYNPNPACGNSRVFIENLATIALYSYTPYQPNPSALSAGWGVGDGCAAYGNRNFHLFFTQWFGSPHGGPRSDIFFPNGIYRIDSLIAENRSLRVNTGFATIQTTGSSSDQRFEFTRTDDGFYTIRSVASGEFLDVIGAGRTSGTRIQTWARNGSCAQRWSIVRDGINQYALLSACSGLALDVMNGSSTAGTGIHLWDRNNTPAQRWRLVALNSAPIEDGTYTMVSVLNNSRAVDIANGSRDNGGGVQIFQVNSTIAQNFEITRGLDGFYTIRSVASGRVLDVHNATTHNGSAIQIWDSNNSCAQKWLIAPRENGQFVIRSACSGKTLDITGGNSANGTRLQLWDLNNTPAQKWRFSLVPRVIDNGLYEIVAGNNDGLALDVVDSGTTNGSRIQTWTRNNTPAQTWELNRVDGHSNVYTIRNPQANRFIHMFGNTVSNGLNIHMWQGWNYCQSKWRLVQRGNNHEIISLCDDRFALDIANGNTERGGRVQMWGRNNTGAQRWTIVERSADSQ